MTQRNIQPQTFQATSPDVPVALPAIAAAKLALVLVLITVLPGAGIGFA
jgi:hypothetical protein